MRRLAWLPLLVLPILLLSCDGGGILDTPTASAGVSAEGGPSVGTYTLNVAGPHVGTFPCSPTLTNPATGEALSSLQKPFVNLDYSHEFPSIYVAGPGGPRVCLEVTVADGAKFKPDKGTVIFQYCDVKGRSSAPRPSYYCETGEADWETYKKVPLVGGAAAHFTRDPIECGTATCQAYGYRVVYRAQGSGVKSYTFQPIDIFGNCSSTTSTGNAPTICPP